MMVHQEYHAAEHVNGEDDIQDATASLKGLATAAQITKLDDIEANADVTDDVNVASTINGATGKTTPVDADEIGLIDSAAANVLKKLSWSNLKAALKTYFDSLYIGAYRQYISWSSDKDVDLTVVAGTHRIPILFAGTPTSITIKSIRAMVGTVPTGAAIIVDIHKNGTTIFTTQDNRPTIAISANDSGEVTNMNVTTVAKGDYFTMDVDQIGSTIAGKDLVAVMEIEVTP